MVWLIFWGGITVLFAQQSWWAHRKSREVENKLINAFDNDDQSTHEAWTLENVQSSFVFYCNFYAIASALVATLFLIHTAVLIVN